MKTCPKCKNEVQSITSHQDPRGMYLCSTCVMVIHPDQVVEHKTTIDVTVKGEIRIPFTIMLNDIEQREKWQWTYEYIQDMVEDSTEFSAILEKAFGTTQIDYIDAAYVEVGDVVKHD